MCGFIWPLYSLSLPVSPQANVHSSVSSVCQPSPPKQTVSATSRSTRTRSTGCVMAVALSPPPETSSTAIWSPATWFVSPGLAARFTPQGRAFPSCPCPLVSQLILYVTTRARLPIKSRQTALFSSLQHCPAIFSDVGAGSEATVQSDYFQRKLHVVNHFPSSQNGNSFHSVRKCCFSNRKTTQKVVFLTK